MPITRLAAAAALIALLAGCTATPEAAPSPSAAPIETLLVPELSPRLTGKPTVESTAAESARLADAIQALVNPATIVASGDQSKLVPAEDDIPGYFTFYRQLTLDAATDAVTVAETLSAVLGQSGWTVGDHATEESMTTWSLVGGPPDAEWFIFVGGGTESNGHPVVTITIDSPEIP